MGFCAGCVKYTLVLLNLLMMSLAILAIVFGATYKDNNANVEGIIAIVIGVTAGCIAFFGCCGAAKQNPALLTIYIAMLVLAIIVHVTCGTIVLTSIFNKLDAFKSEVSKKLLDFYETYSKSSDSKKFVDKLQQEFRCCGMSNHAELFVDPLGPISSCCPSKKNCSLTNKFSKFCDRELIIFLEWYIKVLGVLHLVFAVIDIVCIVLACFVKKNCKC